MSLHLPGNKPRSLHRRISTYSSPCTIHAPIPPSLEQSLDEWLSRTSSSNSVSSDVSNELGIYGNGYSHCLTQSTISTSPTTYTPSSEQQQQHIYSCLCCQLPQCTAWKKIIKVTRKLETETRLAAEVGQSLLQTNDAYKVESDNLKEQVKRCQQEKHALETSLDDAERLNRQLEHEKDKWMWKYEKSQKILNESAADLETANIKSAALTKDVEQSKLEMDKLQYLKIKSYQFGTRQDILESKLQDVKQELVISRKNKLALESKYKKLTTQYETLSWTYQEMCKEAPNKKLGKELAKPLSSITPPTATDIEHAGTDELVAFVKELVSTNNELKSELLTTSTQLNDLRNEMNSPEDTSPQYNGNNVSQNNIGNARNNEGLLDKYISNMGKKAVASNRLGRRSTTGDGRSTGQKPTTTTSAAAATLNTKTRHRSASVRVSKSKSTRDIRRSSSTNKGAAVKPQTTTSSPVVHHHYHYYTDVRQQNASNTNKNMDIGGNSTLTENRDKTFSTLDHDKTRTIDTKGNTVEATIIHPVFNTDPTTATTAPIKKTIDDDPQPAHQDIDSIDTNSLQGKTQLDVDKQSPSDIQEPTLSSIASIKSPSPSPVDEDNNTIPTTTPATSYTTLLNQAKAILHRLRSTDPRKINRRLQRAFDIGELSNMSNSLLQNIMADVDTMYARFSWLTPDENDDDDIYNGGRADTSNNKNNEFLPMVRLFQELLHEIGQLSITINHLQVAYVKKVQENEIQAEQQHHGSSLSTLSSPSSSSSAIRTSNDSITPPPSLLPSGNTSCISSSTKSLASITEHNGSNSDTTSPSHWFSSLFVSDRISTTSSLASTMRTGDDDASHTNASLEGGYDGEQQPNSTTHTYRHRNRQQHKSPERDYSKNRFWPSISSMMDAWNQRPPMENTSTSSSLDREWRWSCSDDTL